MIKTDILKNGSMTDSFFKAVQFLVTSSFNYFIVWFMLEIWKCILLAQGYAKQTICNSFKFKILCKKTEFF